jgi:hypothetical protein
MSNFYCSQKEVKLREKKSKTNQVNQTSHLNYFILLSLLFIFFQNLTFYMKNKIFLNKHD